MKQSVHKDARLMPGTRNMLALLTGWAGMGRPIELTQGTIAKYLHRSVKQIARYLRDARREGYLHYSYRKNRLGMITGLIIHLHLERLRPDLKRKPRAKPANPARTHRSDNNTLVKDSSYLDPAAKAARERLDAALERFRQTAGFSPSLTA
jgi:hypothetical protein